MNNGYYYHAGCYWEQDENVVWSKHTRYSLERAQKEALKMARKGGRAFVECWDSEHGINPHNGDCGKVIWRA